MSADVFERSAGIVAHHPVCTLAFAARRLLEHSCRTQQDQGCDTRGVRGPGLLGQSLYASYASTHVTGEMARRRITSLAFESLPLLGSRAASGVTPNDAN